MALDRYALGDTPSFEIDVWKSDGITPVTPSGPVAVIVTNTRTKVGGAVAPVVSINGNVVQVTLPPAASTGQFRAATQLTVDGIPTIRSTTYDYEVVAASEVS